MTQDQISPSGQAALLAVQTSVEAGADWDEAETPEKQYFYILRGAQAVDIFEPFNHDQKGLADWLMTRRAGKRLCDYAWRVWASSH